MFRLNSVEVLLEGIVHGKDPVHNSQENVHVIQSLLEPAWPLNSFHPIPAPWPQRLPEVQHRKWRHGQAMRACCQRRPFDPRPGNLRGGEISGHIFLWMQNEIQAASSKTWQSTTSKIFSAVALNFDPKTTCSQRGFILALWFMWYGNISIAGKTLAPRTQRKQTCASEKYIDIEIGLDTDTEINR